MKLGNFLAIDPTYEGAGLSRGSRLEREVWDEFEAEPYRLHAVAEAIRSGHLLAEPEEVFDPDEEFPEGRILTRLHSLRERNPAAVKRKKASVLAQTGRLECEVCGFDFHEVYGPLGEGFAECHHTVPVSQLTAEHKTKLRDLVIVCANCHRMLHRNRPLLSVSELREYIRDLG